MLLLLSQCLLPIMLKQNKMMQIRIMRRWVQQLPVMLRKKKKISPMPSCLHRYKFLQCSLFPFFDEPSSLFILHKSPQSSQNSSSASFSVSLMETIMVFFWVKNSCRALHCHRAMAAPFFFLFFFFFFGSKTLAGHYIVTVQWLLLSSSSSFFFWSKKFHRSSHC